VKCVLCQSNCLDNTVDVCGMLSIVRAPGAHHTHPMVSPQQCGGFHIVRGTLEGVFGVVSFPRYNLGVSPCKRGGFLCQSTLIRHIKSKGLQYIRSLPPCVSGLLACLCLGHTVGVKASSLLTASSRQVKSEVLGRQTAAKSMKCT